MHPRSIYGLILLLLMLAGAVMASTRTAELDPETQMTVDSAVVALFTATANAPTPLPMTATIDAAFQAALTATAEANHAGDQDGLVNVNTADQTELETLPGIGPVLAERIIAYRETFGPFRRLRDLDAISGIGPATLDALDGLVTFESD